MNKTTTIHIEPLDEGFVVTIDGKRKAMTQDQLREWVVSEVIEMLMITQKRGGDSMLSFTLETGIPRAV